MSLVNENYNTKNTIIGRNEEYLAYEVRDGKVVGQPLKQVRQGRTGRVFAENSRLILETNARQAFEVMIDICPPEAAEKVNLIVTYGPPTSPAYSFNKQGVLRVNRPGQVITVPPESFLYLNPLVDIFECHLVATPIASYPIELIPGEARQLSEDELEEQNLLLRFAKYALADHKHSTEDIKLLNELLEEFASKTHRHQIGSIENLGETINNIEASLQDKASSAQLSSATERLNVLIQQVSERLSDHTHERSEVVGLSEKLQDVNQKLTLLDQQLADKAADSHTHQVIEKAIANLETAVAGKASSDHQHGLAEATQLTLKNNWVNYGHEWAELSFFKDSQGIVYIVGLVSMGDMYVALATLPEGYRPNSSLIFSCNSHLGTCRIDVRTNGDIVCKTKSQEAFSWVSLDGIVFRAA
ncbi:MAG: hypothetical protein F6K21_05565 [Symploca sp. SIO2D2]|nr:hypothetical protein [Symploca sp. SIO2D2]